MPLSPKQTFEAAIRALPESLQSAASNWLDRLSDVQPDALSNFVSAGGDSRALTHVIACSEFAGNIAISHWQWICAGCLSKELGQPHNKESLRNRFEALLADATDSDSFKRDLRVLRNQALFGILWRDLVSACEISETLNALSDLAEGATNAASAFASIADWGTAPSFPSGRTRRCSGRAGTPWG